MTEQTKKTPARVKGYKATLTVFFPVDGGSIKSQMEASTALHEAEQSGDIAGIVALPGLRLLALKSARFTSIPNDPAAAREEAGSEEGQDAEGEGEPGSDRGGYDPDDEDEASNTAPTEGLSSGRRRRA